MFISLNAEPETQVAALDVLRTELEAKGVTVKDGSWGCRLLVVDDLDGNQLFFNYPSKTGSNKTARDQGQSFSRGSSQRPRIAARMTVFGEVFERLTPNLQFAF